MKVYLPLLLILWVAEMEWDHCWWTPGLRGLVCIHVIHRGWGQLHSNWFSTLIQCWNREGITNPINSWPLGVHLCNAVWRNRQVSETAFHTKGMSGRSTAAWDCIVILNCGKIHKTKFTSLGIFKCTFSGVKYSPIVVPPAPPPISRTLHFVKLKLRLH